MNRLQRIGVSLLDWPFRPAEYIHRQLRKNPIHPFPSNCPLRQTKHKEKKLGDMFIQLTADIPQPASWTTIQLFITVTLKFSSRIPL